MDIEDILKKTKYDINETIVTLDVKPVKVTKGRLLGAELLQS